MDQELEIETDWLKDGMDWKKEQNEGIEREQEAKSMPIGGRRARQALGVGKRVQEHKKHQLFRRLDET